MTEIRSAARVICIYGSLAITSAVPVGAVAQVPLKVLRFWNLTAETIVELSIAPAGTSNWSANLCLADRDHSVDPDERLRMRGVSPGRYDVRVVDQKNRRCLFHDIPVKADGGFAMSISEDQMKGCAAG